jgi:biopolymer transport protein ExbD
MALKGGESGFSRKSRASSEIPTSSLADIAFLLLIFFMVTTTFRKEKKRKIDWPKAQATKKVDQKRKDILHVWLTRQGNVFINDQDVPFDQIAQVVRPIYAENRELVIEIRADRDVPYNMIDTITKQLQAAGAVRVVFGTRLSQRVQGPRR